VTDWTELVDKHGPLVWSTIRRWVTHHDDAADCFQDVFVAALDLSRRQRVFSWTATLRHLATLKAIDCLRRRYRSRQIQTSEMTLEPSDTRTAMPCQRLASNELASALRTSLAAIDPSQSQAFCLICIEAMSYRETATVMGISENHVGVLLNRARAALKQQMKDYAPPTEKSHKP
jgi:RNA polymerase sigma-70 factor, ECF subfamily